MYELHTCIFLTNLEKILHLVSSNLFLSLHFHRPIGQHAYIGFLAWLEHFVQVWSHQDPSVSPHERPVKGGGLHVTFGHFYFVT